MTSEPVTESVDAVEVYVPEDEASPSSWKRVALALLIAVPVVWIVAGVWLSRDALPAMSPAAIVVFVAALAVVPALAGIGWLLIQRTSAAEARRFGQTARAMREEAAALEHAIAALSAAIDEQRARLSDQVRLLTTLGDTATERLATIGRNLSGEIDQADIHARALSAAAEGAQANLATFLATIPRAQSETETLSALLDKTGLNATQHAAALDAQVVALAARGREAEAMAGGAAEKLAAHIARMEATSQTAGTRLETVTARMAEAVDALLDRTAHAVDESRKGIAAQGDAMLAMVGANQAALDTAARESAESLAERISIIEIVIDRIAGRLDAQRQAGADFVTQFDGDLSGMETRLAALHDQGIERSQMLAASISGLGGSADAMTEALRAGEAMATRVIGTTESLLVALDSAAREIDETLPLAIDRLDGKIADSKAVVVSTKPELLALVTAAESTHDAIEAIAQVVGDQRRNVETLSGTLLETLNTGRTKADAMGQLVDEAADRANRFAEEAAPRLIEALLRVRDTASAAADHARATLAKVIPEAADALEASGSAALRRAIDSGLEAQIVQIAEVAETAVSAANRAAERLDEQLRALDTAAATIDTRIEDARATQEEIAQESFARRASLLIEAMNSASIDITATFAPDIADSAWAAYLKGDRGVFTRRAVRLLDASQQREIARLHDEDAAFRDQVNRYIHDFEAMLRTILAQRDGTPLGVTLLSSDMGKLYVALAQAIERLR